MRRFTYSKFPVWLTLFSWVLVVVIAVPMSLLMHQVLPGHDDHEWRFLRTVAWASVGFWVYVMVDVMVSHRAEIGQLFKRSEIASDDTDNGDPQLKTPTDIKAS